MEEKRYDPTVEKIFNEYIEATMTSAMVDVKDFFQKVYVAAYQEGYEDGENDAWDYEYHGSAADIRKRY